MSVFFKRFFLLLVAVILQRSFLDILWPTLEAPAMIIATVISLTFLFGFIRGLGWVLLVLLLHFLLGEAGMFPVFAIGIAYGTSFLSRRLLIERRTESSLALALVAAVSAILYLLLLSFWHAADISVVLVLANALEAALLFPLVFVIMHFHEMRIQENIRSEFRDLRS